MLTTNLSGKGQIVIPKSLRESRRWRLGTRFIVEEITSGILLKTQPDISAHPTGGRTWLHRLPGTRHQFAGHGESDRLLENGLDFADALHLASSPEGVSFYTFNTAFIKRARSLEAPVKAL